ncbi:MAG: HAMP domain-containing histidine kinase [Gammaproteobacteria bacterium]|nr:HAMP domain-containing histidine kinase [Gammaproteobacteria bacterium]
MTPRPSPLYLRMALYIGAAIAGFVLLGLASLVLVASKQLESYLEAREGNLGRDAAQVLASGGRPALRQWMTTPGTLPDGVTVYVLDGEGRDLGGRDLPPQYVRFVDRFVLGAVRDEDDNFRPIRLAPLLVAPDGQRYAFLLLPERIAPWGSPAALAALIIAAFIVIAVVAALIARAFGRPIGDLQSVVRALSDGQISSRAPAELTARRDELGELARDFDAMAIQIENLLASRQQLMRDMSHELRSPLARLQAAIALAERKHPLPPAEHGRIVAELDRMNQAIGDVLRLTRLESEPIRSKYLLKLDVFLSDLVTDERDEAMTREVDLVLESATSLEVVADPQLLRSGFENVLRNAIRYAPARSVVDVNTHRDPGNEKTIVVTIEDRGPGVSPEMMERIFEPYTRLSADADDGQGSGLGLAIARRVFEAHGGRITAEVAEPRGLRVRILLPAAC